LPRIKKTNDSLQNVLNTTKQDTVKVDVAHKLFLKFVLSDTTKAKSYAQQIKVISEKSNYKKGIMTYYYDMGIYHYYRGNYPLSINFLRKIHCHPERAWR